MFKKFNWNGNVPQQYTADYGSQFILAKDKVEDFSRGNGNAFTMDSPGNELALQVQQDGYHVINWSADGGITVKAGRLILDGSAVESDKDAASLDVLIKDMTIGDDNGNFSAGVEIINAGHVRQESPSIINIKKNGYFGIKNIYHGDSSTYRFSLTGNAVLEMSCPNALSVASCDLSGASRAEIKCRSTPNASGFTVQGSSRLWLYTEDVAKGTRFNLIDKGEVFLIRNPNPINFEDNNHIKINFDSASTGYIILDATFGINKDKINTEDGMNFLLRNAMISVDNFTQYDDRKVFFDLTPDYNFMVIGLR